MNDREYFKKGGAAVTVLFNPLRFPACGRRRGHSRAGRVLIPLQDESLMDKDSKEALQVAKELTCKFIETRTVSPGNFSEVFPVVYKVVRDTIKENLEEMEAGD